ncbi:CAP domain-containing protein [Microvirga flavescens]|uniref:CAP domain-containing protein n=1 Tax=Microvirga flavescens TaxID=2249811 RepID=UPI000DDAF1DB|nr:CAP domain-containing protein [Microvirga flavescens]
MRHLLLCALAALALAGCASQSSLPTTHKVLASSTKDAYAAANLISAYRASRGLSAVTVDSRLNEAAEHQARVVAGAGKLSHGDFSGRMDEFGIRGYSAENLSAGGENLEGIIVRWKNSSGHNSNLLMPQARKIGFARANSDGGYGSYWALVLGQ